MYIPAVPLTVNKLRISCLTLQVSIPIAIAYWAFFFNTYVPPQLDPCAFSRVHVISAEYLAAQRASFIAGYPPFDFSGGDGESRFVDRATKEDVHPDLSAQRAVGFAKFKVDSSTSVGGASVAQESLVRTANEWLFA